MTVVIKSEEVIKKKVEALAQQINRDYHNIDSLDLISLTNGASVFCADLMRKITVPVRLHHLGFSSYDDMPSSGQVQINCDLQYSIQDRHVLVLEGLVITGRTPAYVMKYLRLRAPASLRFCAVGIKPNRIEVELDIDYHMFEFDDEWVEGYGIGGVGTKGRAQLVDVKKQS